MVKYQLVSWHGLILHRFKTFEEAKQKWKEYDNIYIDIQKVVKGEEIEIDIGFRNQNKNG